MDDVYVYGWASPLNAAGEKCVVAAVVPREGAGFQVHTVFDACMARLGPGQTPDLLQVLEVIPKTASEKPQDRFLIEALERAPATVYRRG